MSAIIEKSLNSSLAGIVGNQWRTITFDKIKDAYINNYVVYGCINILANDASALPFNIYRGDELMPKDFRLDPQNFSLIQPHPDMSLVSLLYECYIYYWYRGEFMIYIDLDNFMTLEPINPKLMEIEKKDQFGNIISWKWNRKITIPKEQLIYSKMINPDGIRGLPPTDVLEKELNNYDKAREYNTKFFENFGKIGGTLYDERGEINPSAMEDLVTQFNQAHGSSEEAYKTLGLPAGIKYQEFVQTMREMEFLQSNKDLRDRILNTYGIHKSVFGCTDKVDRAVAQTAEKQKWTKVLVPVTKKIQEAFNQCLFRRYFPGYRCECNYNNISALQEDKTEILTRAKILHELGYSTNEINQLLDLGMEDITDLVGDMRFVPQLLIPVDEFTTTEEPEKPSKSIDKVVDILDKDETKAKRNANYRIKYNRIRLNIEKKIANKLGGYFAKQLGKILSIIKENKSIEKINDLEILRSIMALLQIGKEELATLIAPLFEDGSLTASKFALRTLGIDKPSKSNQLAVDKGISRIKGINNYTYKLIRKQIKESIAAGETVNDMSKRIQKVFKFCKSRARTIARTESGQIMNSTTYEEYTKHGVEKHAWCGGQRKSHAAQDGQTVVMGQPFTNGQIYACDGTMGAGENVNCRCCNVPVIES